MQALRFKASLAEAAFASGRASPAEEKLSFTPCCSVCCWRLWCSHVVTSQLQSEGFYGQQGSYYKSKTKIKTSSVLDLSSVMLTEPEQQQPLPKPSLS